MVDTGAGVDIGATTDTGVVGCTDAATWEATDVATRAAMPGVVASMAEAPSAAEVAFTVEVALTVAEASTAEAGPTVVDIGNGLYLKVIRLAASRCQPFFFAFELGPGPNL
jgi:hypothetical protein